MNVIQKFNERKQKALQNTKMPAQHIKDSWFAAAINALSLTSPMTLGISPSEFARLHGKTKDTLSLMDFAVLSNNLESKSAKDLGLEMPHYLQLLKDGENAVAQWQTISSDLDEAIKQQLAQEAIAEKDKAAGAIGSYISKSAEA